MSKSVLCCELDALVYEIECYHRDQDYADLDHQIVERSAEFMAQKITWPRLRKPTLQNRTSEHVNNNLY